VADIVGRKANASSPTTAAGFTGRTKKCSAPSLTAVPRSWVDISISVPVVGIVPSFSTPAAIGIAQSVRSQLVTVGSPLAKKNLLAVGYFHVVFTLPHQLSPLMLQNKKLLYDLLFRASAETLLEIALDPKHLGAEIGFLSVLHTWGQNLRHHPHVHCVIPAGGLSPDYRRWIHPRYHFFLPCHVLSHFVQQTLSQVPPLASIGAGFLPRGTCDKVLTVRRSNVVQLFKGDCRLNPKTAKDLGLGGYIAALVLLRPHFYTYSARLLDPADSQLCAERVPRVHLRTCAKAFRPRAHRRTRKSKL